MTLKLKGADIAERNMRLALNAIATGAVKSLPASGINVLGDSNANAPHDTGTLKESGKLGPLDKSATGAKIKVQYDAPYAGIVHERHDQDDRKYLQRALQKNRTRQSKEIRDGVKQELRRVKSKMKRAPE